MVTKTNTTKTMNEKGWIPSCYSTGICDVNVVAVATPEGQCNVYFLLDVNSNVCSFIGRGREFWKEKDRNEFWLKKTNPLHMQI